MQMIPTNRTARRQKVPLARILRENGPSGLWARLRYRDDDAFDAWQYERDLTLITAALLRLSERRLNRLGLSHSTLVLDVQHLIERTRREEETGREILSLVEQEKDLAIAAE